MINEMRRLVAKHFNLAELKDLCHDLKVEYEDIPGNTRFEKANELVSYCERFGQIDDLIHLCKSKRERINWDISSHHTYAKPNHILQNKELLLQTTAKLFSKIPGIENVEIKQDINSLERFIIFENIGALHARTKSLCSLIDEEWIQTHDSDKGIIEKINYIFALDFQNKEKATFSPNQFYFVKVTDISINVKELILSTANLHSVNAIFITGSPFFDLFSKYWPDFLVDEAMALEAYAKRAKDTIDSENSFQTVAAIHQLGNVSNVDKKIYVPLGFNYKVSLFEQSIDFIDLLPRSITLANRKWTEKEISKLTNTVKGLILFIQHFLQWQYWIDNKELNAENMEQYNLEIKTQTIQHCKDFSNDLEQIWNQSKLVFFQSEISIKNELRKDANAEIAKEEQEKFKNKHEEDIKKRGRENKNLDGKALNDWVTKQLQAKFAEQTTRATFAKKTEDRVDQKFKELLTDGFSLGDSNKLTNQLKSIQSKVKIGQNNISKIQEKIESKLAFLNSNDPEIAIRSQLISFLNTASYTNFLPIQVCIESFPSKFFSPNFERNVILPIKSLSEINQPVIIVGPPGSGKSTFCRWNALKDAESLAKKREKDDKKFVPVYIPLHKLAQKSNWSLESYLQENDGKSALLNETAISIWKSNRATLRLYFDGLDEIADETKRMEITSQVKQFWETNQNLQIIFTSREYVRSKHLSWLIRIHLSELSEENIKELVEQWLSYDRSLIQLFFEQLKQNKNLKSLMHTPLLANLVLLVFRVTKQLPKNKTRLYSTFINLLCGGWDQAKNLNRNQQYGSDVKLLILIELAGDTHFQRKRSFPRQQFRKCARKVIKKLKPKQLDLLLAELIEDGILDGELGIYQFSHFSFQEFLAAKYLADKTKVTDIRRAIKFHYEDNDNWWRETLKFYASLKDPRAFADWLKPEFRRLNVSSDRRHDLLNFIYEAHPDVFVLDG